MVFYASQRHSVGQVIHGVQLIWEVYEPDEIHNRIEYL
jgi:hypothetical protein